MLITSSAIRHKTFLSSKTNLNFQYFRALRKDFGRPVFQIVVSINRVAGGVNISKNLLDVLFLTNYIFMHLPNFVRPIPDINGQNLYQFQTKKAQKHVTGRHIPIWPYIRKYPPPVIVH